MITAKKILLFLGDIILLYVALWLTLLLRYQDHYSPRLYQEHLLPFTLVFFIWITIFFINDLYSVHSSQNDFRFYGYLLQNQFINTILGFAFFYVVPSDFTHLRPQTVLLILVIVYTILFLLWRRLFYFVSSNSRLANSVLFIGVDKEVTNLINEMQRKPQLGYKAVALINIANYPLPVSLATIGQKRDLINLRHYIVDNHIATVVTAIDQKNSAQVSKYLFDTLDLKLRYYSFPDFYEAITGKVPVTSLEKTWFLENLTQGRKKTYEVIKRLEDIFLSLILAIVTSPISLLLILIIKLESPGPIFYTQIRTGRGGKIFRAIKFRSMRHNAESAGQAVWASKQDPRITRIGRLIRTSRLDEIPQVINILRSEMSFVGPRPERPEFIKILGEQIPYYNERLLVKPGLTGWAQINYPYGDSIEDALVKLQFDLFYIKNRSFTLDASIILKTINTVLNRSLGQ
ncbi:MAG: sugar transferase [Candidatus Komeilibacteria bacterium]